MDNFSPWDIADSFRLHEAACLIAGVMPLSKRVPDREELPAQSIPAYVKLGSAYFCGAYVFDKPEDERFQREKLLTGQSTDETGKPDIPHSIGELTGEFVSRAELHRWIAATGIKSAYSFAPVATSLDAESDTAPAQTDATQEPLNAPAPAAVVAASNGAAPVPKNQRPDLLAPLIEKAQHNETDLFSTAVIWPKLCDMAERKTRPLIDIGDEGIKWIDGNDTVQFLSKKALGDRLRRMKKAR